MVNSGLCDISSTKYINPKLQFSLQQIFRQGLKATTFFAKTPQYMADNILPALPKPLEPGLRVVHITLVTAIFHDPISMAH